jgi:hypothetical protein
MKAVIALVVLALAAALGVRYQSPPYRLDHLVQPCDQQAFAHRDSAYSSSTWIASPGENFFQLRFFDRVEGGVCLHPSWAELRTLAASDPRLAHLATATPEAPLPGGKMWGFDWIPDPGTLPNTKYVNLFPAGVLLNQKVMAAAGADGDPEAWRRAKPNILVVGLGSGVGIAVFAHHFPEASITVVDIDRVVIGLVHDHFPLLRWLETQKTADGRARLRLVTRDARQFIRAHDASGEDKYDLIVLDAYTSGSTIPPHLMTSEFYGECAHALADGGLVMSNIIASYERPQSGGTKFLVLGGAIRSQQAAGLTHVHNIPILQASGSFDASETRNNIVLSSAAPIGPRESPKAWERLKAFVPFPELKRGEPAYTTQSLALTDGAHYTSAFVPFEFVKEGSATWYSRLETTGRAFAERRVSSDPQVIAEAARSVQAACAARHLPIPVGWGDPAAAKTMIWQRTDWVEHSREVWAAAIDLSRDAVTHSGEALVGESGRIANAPMFTDARPNADIFNGG